MPRPCGVCSHKKRAEIDERLSLQVVNVAALAEEYGLGKDSVYRHRDKHLPAFLRAFAGVQAPRAVGELAAEAERLYLVTLDALAAAESGTLRAVEADRKGRSTQRRQVSLSQVARLIREARAGLDLIAKLSAASGTSTQHDGAKDAALDARIAKAMDAVVERAALREGTTHTTHDVIDAEVLAEEGGQGFEGARAEPVGGTHGGTWSGQTGAPSRAGVGVPDSDKAPENPRDALALIPDNRRERMPVWEGNPAASEDERRASGFGQLPIRTPDDDHPSDHPDIP